MCTETASSNAATSTSEVNACPPRILRLSGIITADIAELPNAPKLRTAVFTSDEMWDNAGAPLKVRRKKFHPNAPPNARLSLTLPTSSPPIHFPMPPVCAPSQLLRPDLVFNIAEVNNDSATKRKRIENDEQLAIQRVASLRSSKRLRTRENTDQDAVPVLSASNEKAQASQSLLSKSKAKPPQHWKEFDLWLKTGRTAAVPTRIDVAHPRLPKSATKEERESRKAEKETEKAAWRRKLLESDPWIVAGTVRPYVVRCRGCDALVQLDSRTEAATEREAATTTSIGQFYTSRWHRHARQCHGIYEDFTKDSGSL